MSTTDPPLPRGGEDAASALGDAESTVGDDDPLTDDPSAADGTADEPADDVAVLPDEQATEDAASRGPVTAEQRTPLQSLDPDRTRAG